MSMFAPSTSFQHVEASSQVVHTIACADFSAMQQVDAALRTTISPLSHSNICRIYEWRCDQSTNTIYVTVEQPQKTLWQEICDRRQRGQMWTDSEMFTILNSLISALSLAECSQVSHRCISPQSLYWTNGTVKMSDLCEEGRPFSCETMQWLLTEMSTFQSPELKASFQAFLRGHGELRYNCYKSDVYSLGVTMVTMCHLEVPREGAVHMYAQGLLNYPLTQEFLAKMVTHNPDYRPNFKELLESVTLKMRQVYSSSSPLVQFPPQQTYTSYDSLHAAPFPSSSASSVRTMPASYSQISVPSQDQLGSAFNTPFPQHVRSFPSSLQMPPQFPTSISPCVPMCPAPSQPSSNRVCIVCNGAISETTRFPRSPFCSKTCWASRQRPAQSCPVQSCPVQSSSAQSSPGVKVVNAVADLANTNLNLRPYVPLAKDLVLAFLKK